MGVEQDKTYGVILVDAPWEFRNWTSTSHGAAAAQYETMSLQQIKGIPIDKWASEDCILALWATWPHLKDAAEVMNCWGFEYVTGFPWIKTVASTGEPRRGIGFWAQSVSEIMLIGRRGKPKRNNNVHELGLLVRDRVFYAPATRHSQKPTEIHDWLMKLLPGPYLELFGRKTRENWDVWGLETGYRLSQSGVEKIEPVVT